MTENGYAGVISQLERQKAAIDKALEALLEIGNVNGAQAVAETTNARSEAQKAGWATKRASTPTPRKGGMSPEGKARFVAALKRRWAAKKAGASSAPEAVETPVVAEDIARKPRFTAEGRKRLAEAMKKRWAIKRAGVKKTGRKAKAA